MDGPLLWIKTRETYHMDLNVQTLDSNFNWHLIYLKPLRHPAITPIETIFSQTRGVEGTFF